LLKKFKKKEIKLLFAGDHLVRGAFIQTYSPTRLPRTHAKQTGLDWLTLVSFNHYLRSEERTSRLDLQGLPAAPVQ
jgi:hypothetical protein